MFGCMLKYKEMWCKNTTKLYRIAQFGNGTTLMYRKEEMNVAEKKSIYISHITYMYMGSLKSMSTVTVQL